MPLIHAARDDRGAARRRYLGANITVPYKERVAPMVDRLTDEAQATGAVDTITREVRA